MAQINPGELNKKISIYSLGGVDADGYPTNAKTPVWSGPAKFTRTSGTELLKSGADMSEEKVRFLIRYPHATIDRKMVVTYAGDDYEIVYPNDYDDRHEYMEIWAERVATDG